MTFPFHTHTRRLTASLLFLVSAALLPADPVISEFLAINSGINLKDEDGFPADWIEIHNPDSTPVSLLGYSLTDDAANPVKWTFPDVSIPALGYLRVFATGKDRTADPAFLHTNFSLSAAGEYLALIKPDGFSVSDEFAPAYPPQFKDVSYGLGNESPVVETNILPLGAPLTYLVPSAEIGDSWKQPGFDDSSWTASASAIGFNYDDRPAVAATISPNGNVQSEMLGINASIFLRFPFHVVDPAGVSALRLKVKVDDGFAAFLNGTEVASLFRPSGTLAYNSQATSNEEVFEDQEYQVFDLPIAGNLVAGENILAVQAMNRTIGSNDFIFISELDGDVQDLNAPAIRGFFPTPSPGLGNGPPLLDPASEVTFDSTSRAFVDNFLLTLSVPEEGAVIRYTTNGDPVDESSTEYTAPLEINQSTWIRARAFLPSALPGPSRTEGFVKLATTEANFSSNLPVVILSTFGEGGPPESGTTIRKDVFMMVYEPDPVTGRTTLASTPTVTTRGGFRKRGSSSAGFPKYGMSLETWDENNDDRNLNIFGFGSEADWILNARYTFDLALMRNALTYQLSNDIGRWAVDTQFVELYNDGFGAELNSSDYFGVYTFMERIDSDNNRLDIAGLDPWENSPEEVTGGYIVKQDRSDPGESPFSASGFGSLVYVEPDYFQASPLQRSYIREYTNRIYPAVTNANGINPSTGEHFSDLIDVSTFIDNWWLNILVMDPDWGRLSQFYYKDRGGKFSAGPVWDYDRTMGSRDNRDDDPRRWAGPGDSSLPFYDSRYPIWGGLFGFTPAHSSSTLPNPQLLTSRPDLFQDLIDRWYELRKGGLSNENFENIIATYQRELQEAAPRNFARWTALSPGSISGINFAEPGLSGWEREVSHLRGWLQARVTWIDDQFLERPVLPQNGGVVDPGFELVMTSSEGQVYFTTDGSDPRALGGEPSFGAIPFDGGPIDEVLIAEIEAPVSYLVPSDDSLGLTWTQAGFDDAGWTAGTSGVGFETAGGALEPGINTEVRGEMLSQNATCYLRFEFDFNNSANINSLLLGMKYDDGFIAYLNGIEVARDRAPDLATWNSEATGARSDSVAIGTFVEFDLSEHAHAMIDGRNVLAIHGMNAASGNTDFLCLPTLSINHTVAATPVILNDTTFITARSYDGQQWSAPTTATFVVGGVLANAENLVISEIMYDPAPPTAAEELAGFTADSFFEYLEIHNPTNASVDLSEVRFTNGIEFTFAGSAVTVLPPGGRALVVRSIAGFKERYGNGFDDLIAGEFANNTGLSGNGEQIILVGSEGVIADLTYDNNAPWPTSPDGEGPSLVYLANATTPGASGNWRPSVESLGNPGRGDAIFFTGNPTADSDGDGLSAFAEYAYGTDDSIPNPLPLSGQLDPTGGFSFTFPRNLAADDSLVVLELSFDLQTWTPATEVLGFPAESHNGDGTLTYRFLTPGPAGSIEGIYARLRVTQR